VYITPAATIINDLIFYSGMCGYNNSGSIIDSLNNPSNLNLNNKLNKLLQSDKQLFSQTWLTLDILKKVANKAGSSIDDLAKISLYLKEEADFETFANIFTEFVPKDKFPAIEVIIIPNPAPDYSARIQIEAIGFK
tara:strand:+ start:38 stop:445 length:408 start_codon:yes stop_codon:yes gene_type:complete